jgi:hypothetical protein
VRRGLDASSPAHQVIRVPSMRLSPAGKIDKARLRLRVEGSWIGYEIQNSPSRDEGAGRPRACERDATDAVMATDGDGGPA